MVSSSTSEERADRGYKTRDNSEKREYRPRNNDGRGYKSDDNSGYRKKEYKSSDGRFEKSYDNGFKDRDRKNYRYNKDNDSNQRDNHGGEYKKNYNNANKNYGKDFSKGAGQSDRSSQTGKDTKIKEQQPDKMDIVKRLEKEKKAIQKKNEQNSYKSAKSQKSRPQVRVKRTNNIDWTREYENDSYDDDDAYYMY